MNVLCKSREAANDKAQALSRNLATTLYVNYDEDMQEHRVSHLFDVCCTDTAYRMGEKLDLNASPN